MEILRYAVVFETTTSADTSITVLRRFQNALAESCWPFQGDQNNDEGTEHDCGLDESRWFARSTVTPQVSIKRRSIGLLRSYDG